MEIKSRKFKIIAKPNAKENKIECFDIKKNAYRISIKAKPHNNDANIELIKFLSKALKKRIRICSGFKSKEKIVEIGN